MTALLLLIEDDPDLTHLIRLDLQEAGYQVKAAPDGSTGLRLACEHRPQVVVLDLGLPDLDGAEVLRRLRQWSPVPVIVLTALDAVERKVRLLEGGADDYVTKPFQPQELLARVAVQLRSQGLGETFTAGPLELQAQKHRCLCHGQEVRLSPKEFELLLALARSPGRVYTREELSHTLWRGELPTTSNVIDVHLSNLRTKLREVGGYGLIRTLRGMGYALKVPRDSGEAQATARTWP